MTLRARAVALTAGLAVATIGACDEAPGGSRATSASAPIDAPSAAREVVARCDRLVRRDARPLELRRAGRPPLEVASLPARADQALRIVDATGVSLEARLVGASPAVGEHVGDRVVYVGGAPGGGHVIHRPDRRGTEDLIVFERPPRSNEIAYDLSLGEAAAGLRHVAGVLEIVDRNGVPRLRVARPFIADAYGARHAAFLALDGCVADTDPAAPWTRAPTSPGARACRLAVRWGDVAYPAVVDPLWTTTDGMSSARESVPATALADGDVLIAGGYDGNTTLKSAELFHVATQTWATTGNMPTAHYEHTATLLGDGSVLVAGGEAGLSTFATAARYVPATGSFAVAATMSTTRTGHTASLLPDGTVLVAGGNSNTGASALGTTERFDPAANTWTPAATMIETRWHATATELLDGRVLVAGGDNGVPLSTGEIYAPALDSWASTGAFDDPRSDHVAARMGDGRVIIAGGFMLTRSIATANVFDPMTGFWSTVDPIPTARDTFTATTLADGKVLIAGGACTGFNCQTPDIIYDDSFLFDPATNSWQAIGTMSGPRWVHAAAPISGGRVLITGGEDGFGPMNTSEIFARQADGQPCAAPLECESGFCAAGVCCATACDGVCEACASALTGSAMDGVCGLVLAHTDPNGDCADDGAPSCMKDGLCDGAGACEAYAGTGCTPSPCTSAADCASGHCADGICCNEACSGPCETCVSAKGSSADGLCQPVPRGTDPDHDCGSAGATSCEGLSLCDGQGVCAPAADVCSPYLCEAGACPTSCTSNADCAGGSACAAGKCSPIAARCDGNIAYDDSGNPTDCSPYTCGADAKCRSTCGSVSDCVAPNVCNTAARCVAPGAASSDEGCGCGVVGSSDDPRAPVFWLAALVVGRRLALRLALRRARARSGRRSG